MSKEKAPGKSSQNSSPEAQTKIGWVDYSSRAGLPNLFEQEKVKIMCEIYPPMLLAAREWLKSRSAADAAFRELVLTAFIDPSEVNLTRFVAYLLEHELLLVPSV